MENRWSSFAAVLAIVSFVFVLFTPTLGSTKVYHFVVGEIAIFTALVYVVSGTIDSVQERKLGFFNACGIVCWFAASVLCFGNAVWGR